MQIPIQQIDSPIFEIKVKTVKKQSYFRPDGRFSLIQKHNPQHNFLTTLWTLFIYYY
jgi:hypothetical protein